VQNLRFEKYSLCLIDVRDGSAYGQNKTNRWDARKEHSSSSWGHVCFKLDIFRYDDRYDSGLD
jgi:hypothetical protein